MTDELLKLGCNPRVQVYLSLPVIGFEEIMKLAPPCFLPDFDDRAIGRDIFNVDPQLPEPRFWTVLLVPGATSSLFQRPCENRRYAIPEERLDGVL